MISLTQTRPRWLPAHTLAIGFSLSHLILDWHLDLFGSLNPTSLSAVQAFVLVMGAVVYASWAAALVLASGEAVAAQDKNDLQGAWQIINTKLAGMPPATGFHAALLALVVYALVGSSRHLGVGPEPGTAILAATGVGAAVYQASATPRSTLRMAMGANRAAWVMLSRLSWPGVENWP